jgi:hypothetical protein
MTSGFDDFLFILEDRGNGTLMLRSFSAPILAVCTTDQAGVSPSNGLFIHYVPTNVAAAATVRLFLFLFLLLRRATSADAAHSGLLLTVGFHGDRDVEFVSLPAQVQRRTVHDLQYVDWLLGLVAGVAVQLHGQLVLDLQRRFEHCTVVLQRPLPLHQAVLVEPLRIAVQFVAEPLGLPLALRVHPHRRFCAADSA